MGWIVSPKKLYSSPNASTSELTLFGDGVMTDITDWDEVIVGWVGRMTGACIRRGRVGHRQTQGQAM